MRMKDISSCAENLSSPSLNIFYLKICSIILDSNKWNELELVFNADMLVVDSSSRKVAKRHLDVEVASEYFLFKSTAFENGCAAGSRFPLKDTNTKVKCISERLLAQYFPSKSQMQIQKSTAFEKGCWLLSGRFPCTVSFVFALRHKVKMQYKIQIQIQMQMSIALDSCW